VSGQTQFGIFLVGLLLTIATVVVPAQLLASDFQDRLLAALTVLDKRSFDGVIGISKLGESPVYGAYGITKRVSDDPRRTQIDLLSITKTITATAVMRLVEQDRIATDQTLSEFFPGIPADKADISVHQLLTHSAGFKDAVGRDSERLLKDAFLDRAFNSKLLFAPGERYEYSNVGYSVLAAIVELASQITYEEFLQTDLLQGQRELEFGYANVYDPERSIRTNPGLNIDKASWGHRQAYWNLVGNGGLVSTVRSMVEFRSRLLAGEIVSLDSVAALQTPYVQELPDSTHYGYGLVVEDHPQLGRIYWHNGGNRAFSSHWADFSDHDLVIVAAGTGQPNASWAVETLAYCLLKDPAVCAP
jgi:CubicO group peptidase (beta-lactamase class C family)